MAWVTSHMPVMPRHFAAIVGDELATKYFNDGQRDGAGTTLWHELDTSTRDLVAGLSVWAVVFPEALAYATIAGVSPVVGLYAFPAALVLYAAFG